jgi:hypothetical protein
MDQLSPSHLPLPNIDKLIISFDQLHISMPSCDSSTENLVDRILDQPWRSPTNPITGEALPYRIDQQASTGLNSPTPEGSNSKDVTPPHIQMLEREILTLSPPLPS